MVEAKTTSVRSAKVSIASVRYPDQAWVAHQRTAQGQQVIAGCGWRSRPCTAPGTSGNRSASPAAPRSPVPSGTLISTPSRVHLPVVVMSIVGTMMATSPVDAPGPARIPPDPAAHDRAVCRTCTPHGRVIAGSGVDVLLNRMADEPLRGQHRNLAGIDVGWVVTPEHAAEMVDVAVGVDHRRDGAVAPVFAVQAPSAAAAVSVHTSGSMTMMPVSPSTKGDVGQIQTADLVDAVDDFQRTLFWQHSSTGATGSDAPVGGRHPVRKPYMSLSHTTARRRPR